MHARPPRHTTRRRGCCRRCPGWGWAPPTSGCHPTTRPRSCKAPLLAVESAHGRARGRRDAGHAVEEVVAGAPRLGLGTDDQVRACAPVTDGPVRPAPRAPAAPGPGRALPLAPAARATTTPAATPALTTGRRNILATLNAEDLCIMTPLAGIRASKRPRRRGLRTSWASGTRRSTPVPAYASRATSPQLGPTARGRSGARRVRTAGGTGRTQENPHRLLHSRMPPR